MNQDQMYNASHYSTNQARDGKRRLMNRTPPCSLSFDKQIHSIQINSNHLNAGVRRYGSEMRDFVQFRTPLVNQVPSDCSPLHLIKSHHYSHFSTHHHITTPILALTIMLLATKALRGGVF